MTPILFVVLPLVVFLCVLIGRINKAEHYAPQAYYRRKRGGAPVTYVQFVAPALLATAAMQGAVFDSTFNIFFKQHFGGRMLRV